MKQLSKPAQAALFAVAAFAVTCTRSTDLGYDDPERLVLEAVSSTQLTGTATLNVDPAPAVRVRNQRGTPKANVIVTFEVSAGGAVANVSLATDAEGIASAGAWTLGSAPGIQTVVARSEGLNAVIFTASVARAYASVSGSVRVTLHANEHDARSMVIVDAYGPDNPQSVLGQFSGVDDETATFTFYRLAVGTWTLLVRERHPWTSVFGSVQFSFDTTLKITVRANETVVVPEVAMRPVAPFLIVATEMCPWSLAGPPTPEDWGNCDSGYWGGLDVKVEVNGVAGTATAAVHHTFTIAQDQWFVELHDIPRGEYDVSGVVTPRASGLWFPCSTGWRLVPWRASPVRRRLDGGLAYTEFEYWCQK